MINSPLAPNNLILEVSKEAKEKNETHIIKPKISNIDPDEKTNCWQTSPEPWDEPVDVRNLIDLITNTLDRFLVLPERAAQTLAF